MPKVASVMSLQTVTDNLMNPGRSRSAALMRNPERYSPSAAAAAAAAAWLERGPEACWHDRLDMDYLAASKPTNSWALIADEPAYLVLQGVNLSGQLHRVPAEVVHGDGVVPVAEVVLVARRLLLPPHTAHGQKHGCRGGGQRGERGVVWSEGGGKLLLQPLKGLWMQRPWPLTGGRCHCVFHADAQGGKENDPLQSFVGRRRRSPRCCALRFLPSSKAKLSNALSRNVKQQRR